VALFGLRFDFRNPPVAGTSMAERYAAALDMAEWADGLGAVAITLSEHHGSEDGYLPSALTMAAAMAARTRTARLTIAAIVAPLHDPIRLAEEAAVVDLLSGGRLDLILVNGYVASEFEMFGVPLDERVRRTVETVKVLRQAWTGEPFDHRGRKVRVTPRPHRDGGPKLVLGGTSESAARRAARLGDGFMPSSAQFWEPYRDEMLKLGRPDPGPFLGGDTSVTCLARDAEAGWRAHAPFFLHEMNAYGRWMQDAGVGAEGGYEPVADAEALRGTGQYRVVTPDEMVGELGEKGPFGFVMFHPLVGGTPPDLAWEGLRLFESEVLPRL
jgi:alkanesulfonate monooxygenase SsuD/methylene tetrahydromethanopterin reductase-like flavin-dependent oxidoreductase (luciferase family)